MIEIDVILNKVLEKIIPSNEEIEVIDSIVFKLKKILKSKAQTLGIKYTSIEPHGSTGIKQTQLKDDFDIDLFIGLDYNLYEHKYRGLSKNKLKKASKKDFLRLCNDWIIKSLPPKKFDDPRLLYAEHPYVTVDYWTDSTKIKIDIVLYFDLAKEYIKENGPITAVDRSPWHGRFVRDNLSNQQKNDVRLLKQFFKASHSYGDTSAAGKVGFIGYSAELLIYYLNDLKTVFRKFDELQYKPLDFYNRTLKDLRKITHFKDEFLLIIDPIDKNRNVASAISKRAYVYCNSQIKEFLDRPSVDFFERNPIPHTIDFSKNKELYNHIYIVEMQSKSGDIHYTVSRDKLYALGEKLKLAGEREFSNTARFGKIIYELSFSAPSKEYNLIIYCELPKISNTYLRKGPSVNSKIHAKKFKKKNPHFFVKDGYLWTETKRTYNNFLFFLKDFISSNIPVHLKIVNISKSFNTIRESGKQGIYILENMVLPFEI